MNAHDFTFPALDGQSMLALGAFCLVAGAAMLTEVMRSGRSERFRATLTRAA